LRAVTTRRSGRAETRDRLADWRDEQALPRGGRSRPWHGWGLSCMRAVDTCGWPALRGDTVWHGAARPARDADLDGGHWWRSPISRSMVRASCGGSRITFMQCRRQWRGRHGTRSQGSTMGQI